MREKSVMVEPEPTLNEWRNLYQAAMHFKEVAPWEWMRSREKYLNYLGAFHAAFLEPGA